MPQSRFAGPRRSLPSAVRHHIAFVLLLTLALAGVARAQPAANVGAVIADAASGMASGDRDKVVAARQALVGQLTGHADDKTFLGNYSRDLAAALAPIVDGNDPHAKLNAAIVIGRVADLSGSTVLSDVCAKLIRDPSPAIAAWGMRASANVLPRVLADVKLADADPIVPALLAAVQKNPQSEAVAAEAYSAMTRVLLDTRGAAQLLGPQVIADATPRTVDALQRLIALRVAMMGHNELAEPAAEQPAISFFGRQTTWTLSTPPQQLRTIGALLDVLNGAVAELESIPAEKQTGEGRERALALRGIIKQCGQSLSVISEVIGKADLKTTAKLVEQLGAATPIAEYKRVAGAIEADFAKAFPDVRPATKPSA